MYSALAGKCLLMLYLFCNPVYIVFSDVSHTVDEGKPLRVEGHSIRKEEVMRETQHSLKIGDVRSSKSSLPDCVKLAGSEPLALHSDGDIVIGGFFTLHYVVPKPQQSYNSKPQILPCSG